MYNQSMSDRKKILILEKDDFLREIIGKLLHEKGGFMFSAYCVSEGINAVKNHTIDTIILGTSCDEYRGKETLGYIRKKLNNANINFYILNHSDDELDFIPKDQQIKISDLSVAEIVAAIKVS